MHERRIRDAVALKTPDRVPVVPVGDAFAAHVAGVKVSEFCTDPVVAYKTMVEVFTGLGELDGIQHAGYNVNLLSIIWLSKVKIPGRDLGENDDWQVQESEVMTEADYDAIIDEGFGSWVERYYAERLPGVAEGFGGFVQSLPDAFAAWREKGGRRLQPRGHDDPLRVLLRRALHAEVHARSAPPTGQGPGRHGCVDALPQGADAPAHPRLLAHGPLARRLALGERVPLAALWERFVFPYYKELADVAVEEGAIPVLHFDADWTRDLERFKEFPKGKCVLVAGRQDGHLQGQGGARRPHVPRWATCRRACSPWAPRRK